MPYRSNNGPIEINRNANGFTWVLLSGRTFALTPGLVNLAVAFLPGSLRGSLRLYE